MDFDLTEEQERFRQQIRDFLNREVTDEVIAESEAGLGYGAHSWALMRKLGARGWLAPTFPREYGGLGLPSTYRFIVAEELDYRNALSYIKGFGIVAVDMVGPSILRYGSEELKREFLPRIAGGEIDFALGYTEPNAGSDLSGISIRAVEDGDHFMINGQKTFNTGCHWSQYHWLAARTDPAAPLHKGISMIIVDLKKPGITISPLWEMSGTRTNEVFYDDVRVPRKNLVGEKNRGWYYMVSALDLERVISSHFRRTLEALVDYCGKTVKGGSSLSETPWVRGRIADIAIEVNVARNLVRQVVGMKERGKVPNYESAVLKVFVTELFQRIVDRAMEVLGLEALLTCDSKHCVLGGKMERIFRESIFHTIGGGTSEMMRNIIARRGLGLPEKEDAAA